jgi:hypothetical protein
LFDKSAISGYLVVFPSSFIIASIIKNKSALSRP